MKSLLPALAFTLLAGGAPDEDFRSERQILNHLTVKLAQLRTTSVSDVSELSGSVSRLKSLLEQMTTQAADLKYQDDRVHNFEVTDLEPKSHGEATLRRDYGERLKILVQNQKALHAAHGPPTANNGEAVARCEAMGRKIQEVEAEGNLKLGQAIQTYADAQRDYAALLSRKMDLQAALDQSSGEFRTLRGRAVTQLHSLESALLDLRRAAGSGELIQPVQSPVILRKLGSDAFDWHESAAPVNLPDVVTPDGVPLSLARPPASVLHPHAPAALAGNSKAQALQAEAVVLHERERQLQVEKVRLFSDKNVSAADLTAYSQKAQKLARETAVNTMITRGLGGSELMDLSEMNEKPQTEPPVPGKETK